MERNVVESLGLLSELPIASLTCSNRKSINRSVRNRTVKKWIETNGGIRW